jgi:t-SNARE complex subunit (syntaxin)
MVDRLNDLTEYNKISDDVMGQSNDGVIDLLKPIKTMDLQIKSLLDDLTKNIIAMNGSIDRYLNSFGSEDKIRAKQAIDDQIQMIDRDMLVVKKIIDCMKAEKCSKSNSSKTVHRIIDLTIQHNIKKFSNCYNFYNDTLNKYNESVKNNVRRQLLIVDKEKYKNVTDGELEQIIKSNHNVFGVDMYKDIQERHDQIIELEKSVAELGQLFKDMQILVNTQGDMINTIEDNVEKTDHYVESGLGELRIAAIHQKKNQKKKWFIILCIVITSFILFAIGMSYLR